MNTERIRLHRTISNPNPTIHPHSLQRLPSQSSNQNPELKTKLSHHSCPEEEEDEKIQSLNNNLDDLFTRINQLAEEVVAQQKSQVPLIEIKPQVEKVKPVYIDKRVHKRSFEVVEIPKMIQEETPIKGLHIRQFQFGNKLGQGKFG